MESKDKSPLPLLSLNDPLLNKVLSFVSNVPDFCSCALSCARLRTLLQDDDAWKYCKGKRTIEVTSNRKRALEHNAIVEPIRQIKKHQSGEHFADKNDNLNLEQNYILKFLQLQGLRDVVSQILICIPHIEFANGCIKSEWRVGNKVRRSVLITLANLVQANMIHFLEGVNLISIHRSKDACSTDPRLRPSVRLDDIDLADHLTTPVFTRDDFYGDPDSQVLVENQSGRSIAEALLRVSGIANEENGVVDRVWLLIVRLLWKLIIRAAVSMPPELNWNNLTTRHVEDTAERLGCHHSHVYGSGNTEDDSEDDYEICDETSKDESLDEDDCATLSNTGSSSDISVYSDKDCPDKDGEH